MTTQAAPDWRAGLWRGIGHVIAPGIRLWLQRRVARGKEDAARLPERFGSASLPRPDGRLIWSHAASVGEAMALLPLLERLQTTQPGLTLLLTTGTVTSAALVAARAPGLLHQFLPVDLPGPVDAFLNHWRPDLVLWSESELWPGLLGNLAQRGIPALLLNGRLSDRSARRWARLPGTARWLLGAFETIYAQSAADGDRFRQLGARDVRCIGNLKQAAPPLPADTAQLADLQAILGQRPRWLMASTHPGDEAAIITIQRHLAAQFPDLLGLIVPRHPERGAALAETLRGAGFRVSRRAAGEAITADTQIHIADTLGELGLWYRLCPAVVMGGSLIPHGGQNPLEPARLGAAVLFGPHMFNFAELSADLLQRQAALQAADAAGIAAGLAELLANPTKLQAMGAAGRAYATARGAVLDEIEAAVLQRLKTKKAEET